MLILSLLLSLSHIHHLSTSLLLLLGHPQDIMPHEMKARKIERQRITLIDRWKNGNNSGGDGARKGINVRWRRKGYERGLKCIRNSPESQQSSAAVH